MKQRIEMNEEYGRFITNNKIRRGYEYYINEGQMDDGHKAYSKVKIEGNCYVVEDEEQCAYIQVRNNGHLEMTRI